MSNKTIILTAGGTGGHIYPAESLAAELQKRGCKVIFYTDSRGLTNYHGALKELPIRSILSGSVVGKSLLTKLISLCKVALGVMQAALHLLQDRPNAVAGFGGYASFPTALAAILLRIPLVIHEQNSVMSRTNRILARFANVTAQSFRHVKNTPPQAKELLSGMPIRASIAQLHTQPHRIWNEQSPFVLLILGGSQGAKVFGSVVPHAISMLDEELQKKLIVYQQCRQGDDPDIRASYASLKCQVTIAHFFDHMDELYQKSDLMISRSGASSIYEIAAVGMPSILVPLPTAADNHQYYNAKELDDCNGALLIEQKDFTPQNLSARLSQIISNPVLLKTLSDNARSCAIIDASARLAEAILKL